MAHLPTEKSARPLIVHALVAKTSKLALIRQFGGLSLAKIVKDPPPSIGALARQYDPERAEKFVGVLVQDLSESFGGDLTERMVDEIAATIAGTPLRSLSLEDVFLVCQGIKETDQRGRLTVNKVMVALKGYANKRMEAFRRHHENQHLAGKFIDRDRSTADPEFEAYAKKYHIEKLAEKANKKLSTPDAKV